MRARCCVVIQRNSPDLAFHRRIAQRPASCGRRGRACGQGTVLAGRHHRDNIGRGKGVAIAIHDDQSAAITARGEAGRREIIDVGRQPCGNGRAGVAGHHPMAVRGRRDAVAQRNLPDLAHNRRAAQGRGRGCRGVRAEISAARGSSQRREVGFRRERTGGANDYDSLALGRGHKSGRRIDVGSDRRGDFGERFEVDIVCEEINRRFVVQPDRPSLTVQRRPRQADGNRTVAGSLLYLSRIARPAKQRRELGSGRRNREICADDRGRVHAVYHRIDRVSQSCGNICQRTCDRYVIGHAVQEDRPSVAAHRRAAQRHQRCRGRRPCRQVASWHDAQLCREAASGPLDDDEERVALRVLRRRGGELCRRRSIGVDIISQLLGDNGQGITGHRRPAVRGRRRIKRQFDLPLLTYYRCAG